MGRGLRRALVLLVVLGMVVTACGDDEGGETFTTTTVPGPEGTAGETTTTAAWGQAVEPGAEAMVEGSGVLLREDFQDGDTAGWEVEAGWYVLENGERRMAAAGGQAWAWRGDGLGWSRYAVRLAFLVRAGSLGASVAVGEDGRYIVQVSEQGVYLLRDAPYGSVQALGSSQPVNLADPHVLAVGLDGGHLQVYVDGVLQIDATDPAPLLGGTIGLGAGDGSSVAVDNIVVASLRGPLPGIQAAAAPADQPLPDEVADAAPQAGEQLEEAAEPAEPGVPNLVMSTVSVPAVLRPGETFEVSMTVVNAGTGDVAGEFMVQFYGIEERACGEMVDGLAAGAEVTVTCEMTGPTEGDAVGWAAEADRRDQIDEGGLEDDNVVQGTLSVGGTETEEALPNLKLGWRDVTPKTPTVGEPVSITFEIVQTEASWQGQLSTFAFAIRYENGGMACRTVVGPPDFGGTCELPGFEAAGEYALQTVTDVGEEIEESYEEDNINSITLVVVESEAAEPPNLVLEHVNVIPSPPTAGEQMEIHIRFHLYGDVASVSPYTIRWLVDDVVACSVDVTLAGAEQGCFLAGPPAGPHEWRVELDADNDIAESNEVDNAGVGRFTSQE